MPPASLLGSDCSFGERCLQEVFRLRDAPLVHERHEEVEQREATQQPLHGGLGFRV